jgi:tRNA/rRNA methyltransferase/tRNA (cytidine32/uridine32-2'-O)-methyltransferase
MKKPFPETLLNQIRIVMVRTSHSGNIGAAARAMRVMGLYNLVLVEPKQFPSQEAISLASGAVDVLESAIVVPTLEEALKDCQVAYATTARPRYISSKLHTVEEAAVEALQGIKNEGQQIAFVFGTERTGLTNEEIDLCQRMMTIPSENSYNSLNISAAIQVVSYELHKAHKQALALPLIQATEATDELATGEMREGFYEQLQDILFQTEFLDPAEPKNIMKKIRHLFQKRDLTTQEIHLLRGILTSLNRKINHD